jgi:hypothetical protein
MLSRKIFASPITAARSPLGAVPLRAAWAPTLNSQQSPQVRETRCLPKIGLSDQTRSNERLRVVELNVRHQRDQRTVDVEPFDKSYSRTRDLNRRRAAFPARVEANISDEGVNDPVSQGRNTSTETSLLNSRNR